MPPVAGHEHVALAYRGSANSGNDERPTLGETQRFSYRHFLTRARQNDG